jgi:hypothetical protein
MKPLFSILIFIFSMSSNYDSHETYTTITDITFSKERKSVEVSIEITAHDIVYLFDREKLGELKSIINNENEEFENQKLKIYINKHLKLYNNNDIVNLKLIGNSISLDGVLTIYMESIMKKPFQNIEVFNDLLITTFPNQQNIVNLNGTINASYTFNKYEIKHFF